MQTANIFNYSGAPWLSQHWTRKVTEQAFSGVTSGSGYNGDEDQGLMGALAVLLKMGIFELHGGAAQKPFYEITSPIFEKIVIHLDSDYYLGEKFVIIARNSEKRNFYVRSAPLNGKRFNQNWIYHEELVKGDNLELILDPEPNKNWGTNPKQRIPLD